MGKYMTASLLFRGPMSTQEVDENMEKRQSANSDDFVEWIPNNMKTSVVTVAPKDRSCRWSRGFRRPPFRGRKAGRGPRAPEPLVADGDDLAVGKLIGLLEGGGGSGGGHLLLEVKGDVAELLLDVTDNLAL